MSLINKIAEGVSASELKMQRALGADAVDCYLEAWAVYDDVCRMLEQPERPAVYGRGMRMITGRGT